MKAITFLFYFFLPTKVFADPFGFVWGSDLDNIELAQSGECKKQDLITTCHLTEAPTNIEIAKEYILTFHDIFGLQKITMISNGIKGEVDGGNGVLKYSQLKNLLEEKYQSPKFEYEFPCSSKLPQCKDRSVPDIDFYECLKEAKCGSYMSVYSYYNGSIKLRLVGIESGVGAIELEYLGPKSDESFNKTRSPKEVDLLKAL